jgi:hypothetical protein
MWMTGAASDALVELLGADDPCCGRDDASGGCGKCLLIQNPDAENSDWTAVVMKKNRCPPWTNGCGADEPHFDVAAPGFDNLQYSTANICGAPGTGFANKTQSAALGTWYSQCSDTSKCLHLCDKLPAEFIPGCKLFAAWGWKRGDPDKVKFKAVQCPDGFVAHVGSLFGPKGVASQSPSTPNPPPPATPNPTPNSTPATPDPPSQSEVEKLRAAVEAAEKRAEELERKVKVLESGCQSSLMSFSVDTKGASNGKLRSPQLMRTKQHGVFN